MGLIIRMLVCTSSAERRICFPTMGRVHRYTVRSTRRPPQQDDCGGDKAYAWRVVASRQVSRSQAFDVARALGVTLLALVGSAGEVHPHNSYNGIRPDQHPGAWAYVLLIAVPGLALIWRRRAPLTIYALGVVGTTVWAALGYVDGAAALIPLVGLYTVASSRPRRVTLVAAAGGLAAMWVAEGLASPFGWFGGANSVLWAEVIAAVALGFYAGARRQWVAAMRERAERAERMREEEARRRVDAERLRIARELHDVVAHSMATINVQASAATHLLERDPTGVANALQAIREASKEGLRELRAILNVLRGVDEAEPIGPAPRLQQLEALVDATTQAGVVTQLYIEGSRAELPASVELAAYRIVQESLTNVLRHAAATHATVRLAFAADRLVVQVDDDGTGGAPGSGEGSGTGIAGMQERAAAFGGHVDARPNPGGGFRVRATIPRGLGAPVAGSAGTPGSPAASPAEAAGSSAPAGTPGSPVAGSAGTPGSPAASPAEAAGKAGRA